MSRSTMSFEDPESIIIVGLDTIEKNQDSPLYDERVEMDLPEELISSIREHGVQQNVVTFEKNNKLVCVDGRQRVRAARELNRRILEGGGNKDDLVKVPVTKYIANGVGLMGLGIALNEIRYEDPVPVKAAKLQRYLKLGRTMEDASRAFGVQIPTLQNWLSIGKLTDELQEQVNDGTLSVNAAVDLSSMEEDDQKKVAEEVKEAKEKGQNPKMVAKAVSRRVAKNTKFAKSPGRRLIKKLISYDQRTDYVSDDFVKGAAWASGQIETKEIEKLDKLIKKLV
ncbi:MAG: ParB/RepB/Spo0J family partition protein [Planctomycetota bacterium]